MPKVKIGIIGGSGFNKPGILVGGIERVVETPFGYPSSPLVEGKISGVDCVLLARHGREHTISPSNVNYRANIWALKEVGCTHVIVSSACGSLQEDIKPGDLVIVDSFIDRTYKRKSTFYDSSTETPLKDVVHFPMEPAFCPKTRRLLLETARELTLPVHEGGSVVTIEGPRFSSKAESNMFRLQGGSLVNMTLVPEVCLAREAGLLYAAVAMATDYDCWRCSEVVSVVEVLKNLRANAKKVKKLFLTVIPKIAEQKWDDEYKCVEDTCKYSNQTNISKLTDEELEAL